MPQDLADLLCELFDARGLRRFLRTGEQGEDIAVHLPGDEAPLVHLADVASEQLRRRGLVAPTVARLWVEFPRRRLEVEDVARRLGLDKDAQAIEFRPHSTELLRGPLRTRMAGGILSVYSAQRLLGLAVQSYHDRTPAVLQGVPKVVYTLTLFIVMFLGVSLMRGRRKEMATFAVYGGLSLAVVETTILSARGAGWLTASFILFYAPVLMLLRRRAPIGKLRTALLAVPLLYYLAGLALGTWMVLTGRDSWTHDLAIGSQPVTAHFINGASGYRIDLPTSGWRKADPEQIRRLELNEGMDMALVHVQDDVVLTVFEIPLPEDAQKIDAQTDDLLMTFTGESEDWEILEREPHVRHPSSGEIIHLLIEERFVTFECLMAVVRTSDRLFQVNLLAPRDRFAVAASRLRGIVESFEGPVVGGGGA